MLEALVKNSPFLDGTISRRTWLRQVGSVAAYIAIQSQIGCSPRRRFEDQPLVPSFQRVEDRGLKPLAHETIELLNASSFLFGGFECSTHWQNGRRNDMVASTKHDRFARQDYARLTSLGMDFCRDGISWVSSEPSPGRYDFSRARPMVQAAREAGVTVAWDLMHFGWPDHIDVFATSFPKNFAGYATEVARLLQDEGVGSAPVICPINEISFLAWAGGDQGFISPLQHDRGPELKVQMVRAAIEAMHAFRGVIPGTRFFHCDPIIHVAPRTNRVRERDTAEYLRVLQFQSWDMISGRSWKPQLGGSPDLLDIVGVNYYRNNQRYTDGEFIDGNESSYRPLSEMLNEVASRYQKPIVIAETGAEERDRPEWINYVASECTKAMKAKCPLYGVTWYPIVNHPGWVDDRHVLNGLWDYADAAGDRPVYQPLADEITRLNPLLRRVRADYVRPKLLSAPQESSAPT
ncbi:MAG: beta-glucosidase [Gemmataceae bacterium]